MQALSFFMHFLIIEGRRKNCVTAPLLVSAKLLCLTSYCGIFIFSERLHIRFFSAFQGELNKVLSLGVAADRIIFANPAKPASHIRHAASLGVGLMTFDNETELHKVKELHPDAK